MKALYAVAAAIMAGCASVSMTKQVEVCQGGECAMYEAEKWYTRDCSGERMAGQCELVENIRVNMP